MNFSSFVCWVRFRYSWKEASSAVFCNHILLCKALMNLLH
jgi:hypothetical protein